MSKYNLSGIPLKEESSTKQILLIARITAILLIGFLFSSMAEVVDMQNNNAYLLTESETTIEALKTNKETISLTNSQQSPAIRGVVVDETGEALIGVNIVIKGTSKGTVTDFDGNFTLLHAEGDAVVLQVSYIGFQTQEVKASVGKRLNIVMSDDAEMLSEVIVTGYGSYKRSSFTGSASTVGMDDKDNVPTSDFNTLIQGSASGVQVNAGSGTVGGSSSITIRGMGSINASTSPLYVIDGVPAMSSVTSGVDGGTDFMSTINPSDIENITVIKDAAAASLYGSRAANGVILITTKRGKEGKPVFKMKADWGFSDYATDYRETMTGPQRREALHEGLVNQGLYMRDYSKEEAQKYADDNIDKYAPKPASGWEDWENALFRSKAPYQSYSFSAAGGDKKTTYYTSLAYTDQQGLVRQQDFNRITARLNVTYQMNDKLQLGANVLFSTMTQNGSSEGGTYTSPIYSTRHKVSASDPIYNEDGSYNKDLLANKYRNPKSALDYNYQRQKVKRSFNTVFANYDIIDGLVFNTTYSLDHGLGNYKSWQDPRSTDGEKDNGSLSENMYEYNQMVWKNNLNYVKTFDAVHNVDAIVGYETHEYKRHYLSNYVKDFPNVDKHEISNGANISGFGGSSTGWRLLSYLGRVNYDFDSKYYFSGSLRTDASSRFHKDSRWGVFWALSGAWRLSSEPFMKPFESFLTDAKVRFSYGTNGTQPSSYFGYMDLVGFGYNYDTKPGILENQIGDRNLEWEKSANMNFGLEMRLFDRVNLTLDLYERKSKDLLMPLPISRTTGFGSILTNIGELRNRGVEFEVSSDIIRNRDFRWNSSLNLGHNKNKLMDLGGQDQIVGSYTINKVGHPYRMYHVKEFAGINPDNGFPQYYVNATEGDRTITEDESEANYIMHKGPDPKLSGGWNNTFKYKMVDFSFLWTFTVGGYSFDRAASKLDHGGQETEHNMQAYYLDRWKKPGDVTDIEMVMVGNPYNMSRVYNSRRVHSTDHLRLKNITLGISLPKKLVRKGYLENVRAYFSAVNMLTFAKYDGYDPEVPSDGLVYFETPKMKTLTFGIDITF